MENILGYYLMPHPPIIIEEIGVGEEGKIEKTSMACHQIGEEIAKLKPETIILITPHATMFSDAIAISDEERIKGDLRQFGCSCIKMNLPIDRVFAQKLNRVCEQEKIPAALIDEALLKDYNRQFELDHGTIVPLYFVNKYYQDYHLVHITYAQLGNMDLYRFGMQIKEVANLLGRKCVIIASGDLSHKLKEEGPYSYSPYGEKFDHAFLGNLQKGDVDSLFQMDKTLIEEAAECGLNSVYILVGAMEGKRFSGELLSYEGPFGVGYGVMKFSTADKASSGLAMLLKAKQDRFNKKLSSGNPYARLARESLNYYFKQGKLIEDLSHMPSELLNKRHGVFVSLKKFGELRGCIGTIAPTTSCIGAEIVRNAVEAALQDPRFPPVAAHELEDIDISVDVLMEAIPAKKETLDPKKYGVIVTQGHRRGLLLPDLEGVDTVDKQLNIACRKAGIEDDNYQIEMFEVIRYKEGE